MVQEYILCVRAKGGIVNTAMVIAGARGLLQSLDRARLAEYGGLATMSRGWAKSLLKFSRRMGTTQATMSPDDLKQKKIEFLQKVVDIVTMEEIPSELILTGIRLGLTWCQDYKVTNFKGFKR